MQNFEYENLQVINDQVNELNVLLKREHLLQDSIYTSINNLNDYTKLQEIKAIMRESMQKPLTYDEQTKFKNLLITVNVFSALYDEYPMIFHEINLDEKDLMELTVEQQNMILKRLLVKVTTDNNKLIDYLKYEQSDQTLMVVNKFKIFINNQYTQFLHQIKEKYDDHVFPLEDLLSVKVGVNNISDLTTLKKVHLILNDMDASLKTLN